MCIKNESLWKIPFMTFSGWWFQTFFIFIPTWGKDPIWLIFLKWLETTNQMTFFFESNIQLPTRFLPLEFDLKKRPGDGPSRDSKESQFVRTVFLEPKKKPWDFHKVRLKFWVEILFFVLVTRTEMQPQKTSWRSFCNLFSVWWCSESWWMTSWFVYYVYTCLGGSWRLKGGTSRMMLGWSTYPLTIGFP